MFVLRGSRDCVEKWRYLQGGDGGSDVVVLCESRNGASGSLEVWVSGCDRSGGEVCEDEYLSVNVCVRYAYR